MIAIRMIRLALGLALVLAASTSQANIIFEFDEVGGTVVMTSSGTLDTTKLVSVSRVDGWGGTGTEDNPTAIDIMGGTSFGAIDTQFEFHAGTDVSAITNPGGPFSDSNFDVFSITGSRSFTTYSGFIGAVQQPGIAMISTDIDAGLWTPDQDWTYNPGDTFASLHLTIGTYAVSDVETGETITIRVVGPAAVPEPGTLALLALGFAGFGFSRRRKQ
jgi:hypothetical protein